MDEVLRLIRGEDRPSAVNPTASPMLDAIRGVAGSVPHGMVTPYNTISDMRIYHPELGAQLSGMIGSLPGSPLERDHNLASVLSIYGGDGAQQMRDAINSYRSR